MKANTVTFSLAAILCLLMVCSAWGKVIYVDDDAPTGGNGTSWTAAYRFLQDALTDAEATGEAVEVRVAQGTYTPNRSAAKPQGGTGAGARYFLLTDGVSLLGGYAGLAGEDPNARDIRSYQTVLSGDLLGNDAPVTDASMLTNEPTRDDNSEVIRLDCGEVRLEGCTITGGGYGGLHVAGMPSSPDSTVRISDCTLKGNRYPVAEWVAAGAANVLAFVDVVFERCSFVGNAGFYGAMRGVGYGHEIVLDGCEFARNYARGLGGGAAYLDQSTITNCVFTENRAYASGGALRLSGISGINHVANCVFRGNRANWGGAILCDGHSDVRDCLFVGNEAAVGGGAGQCISNPYVTVSNCVLAGNRA
ncbi:MAG: right-handed parallel beta-helix repeat-containing protein, partial [Phycisphaerales bacterium]